VVLGFHQHRSGVSLLSASDLRGDIRIDRRHFRTTGAGDDCRTGAT
jgi:hypothetical protein